MVFGALLLTTRDFKITLITSISDIQRSYMPWNLMTLVSVCRQEGINADLIDVKTDQGPDHAYKTIFEKLAEDVPDVVGLPCSTVDVTDVRRIATDLKRCYPDIKIVVGGIHATMYPDDFFEEDYGIDYVVTGYGEIPLTRLLKALRSGDDPAIPKIPNLTFKDASGVVTTETANEQYDLALLPKMDFGMLDMNYYIRPMEDLVRGVPITGMTIYTTRGCPFKCSFCVSGGLWEIVKSVQYKTVDYVVDELEYFKKTFHIDGFYIYDDVFILNKKFAMAVCDEIIRRKLNLVWGCQSTVHVVDEEIAEKMAEAGCVQMDFGVESGSQSQLERMNKSWAKQDKTVEAFKICRKNGIRTLANWMFNGPQETEADVNATFEFAKRISANTNVFSFYIPYPGGGDAEPFWKDKKVDVALFENFSRGMSWKQHLETVDNNFRQSQHNMKFVDMYKRIVREFPVRSNFHLKFSLSWLKHFNDLISWVYSPWFWGVLLRSKHKPAYIKWFVKRIKGLLPQMKVSFEDKMDLHLSETLKPTNTPGQTVRIE